eukprot:2914381-Pyramimonas_sp.AAC.1
MQHLPPAVRAAAPLPTPRPIDPSLSSSHPPFDPLARLSPCLYALGSRARSVSRPTGAARARSSE